ncbi:MAG: hypothetical protein ACKO3I_00815 [Synechococcales cyanobacterium]
MHYHPSLAPPAPVAVLVTGQAKPTVHSRPVSRHAGRFFGNPKANWLTVCPADLVGAFFCVSHQPAGGAGVP